MEAHVASLQQLSISNSQQCLTISVGLRKQRKPHRRIRQLCRAESDGWGSSSSSSSSSVPDCLPIAGVDTDWRSFRAKLVASTNNLNSTDLDLPPQLSECWAHSLPGPEKGCLLLSSPLMFSTNQTYFNQAVILIVEHGPQGSMGIILNKPMKHLIGDVLPNNPSFAPEFTSSRLYLGGDCDPSIFTTLHGIPGLSKCEEIVKGVFIGGLDDAKRGVAEGLYKPEQFKIANRYCGWRPGQLEDECRRGTWYTAAASHHVILQPTVLGMEGHMWLAVMQLLGGDYAAIAEAATETYNADIMGLVDGRMSMSIGDGGLNENEDGSNRMRRGGSNESGQQEQMLERWEDPDEIGGTGI